MIDPALHPPLGLVILFRYKRVSMSREETEVDWTTKANIAREPFKVVLASDQNYYVKCPTTIDNTGWPYYY